MAVVSFRAGGCSERARARKAPLRWFPTEALDCPSQETGREARIAAQPRIVSSRDGNCPDFRGAVDLRVCKSFVLPLRLPLRDRGPGFRRGTAGGMLALARCDGRKNSMTRAARQMRRLTPPRPLAPRPPKAPEAESRRPVVSSARRHRKDAAASPEDDETTRRRDDEQSRLARQRPQRRDHVVLSSRQPVVLRLPSSRHLVRKVSLDFASRFP